MKDVRSKIAQIIVDMKILERKEITKKHMIDTIKEVNDSKMIGHAVRFVRDENFEIVAIQKYRKTAVEKRMDKELIEELTNGKPPQV